MPSHFTTGGCHEGMHENADTARDLPWFTSMQSRLGSLYYSYIFQKPKAPSLMEVASG